MFNLTSKHYILSTSYKLHMYLGADSTPYIYYNIICIHMYIMYTEYCILLSQSLMSIHISLTDLTALLFFFLFLLVPTSFSPSPRRAQAKFMEDYVRNLLFTDKL